MSSPSKPRIAIIGAGPAGLTVGVLLHKHNIPFTIFELRQKPTDAELSKPSGMLDLHEESGIAAIKECGLWDEFVALTGECSEAQVVADQEGKVLYTDEGELSERPEISRHALTGLLLSRVPTHQIKWGCKLLSASYSSSSPSTSEIELDFGGEHGKHVFDLVIGADGAWSKVRRTLLTDEKPRYSGTQCITLTVRDITSKQPKLAKLVGLGSFVALGHRHGVMSQRGPHDSARIYIMLSSEDEGFARTAGLEGKPAKVAKEDILNEPAMLGGWGATIKELVSVACDDDEEPALDIRPLYVLPVGHAWPHRAGATIIGDAAHLMGPWAGEGVNLAMWDSLLVSHAIIKAASETSDSANASFQSVLDPLMEAFEVDLVARAREKAEESFNNGEMMFGQDDAAQAMANFFLSFGGPPAPEES